VELDCTEGGSSKRDRFVIGPNDDGETVVTKSISCALAAYGLLGVGRALPVYIVTRNVRNGHEISPPAPTF
jgi:hypothetical protein